MKSLAFILMMLLAGCATTGKRYQLVFQDELTDIKGSLSHGSLPQAIQDLTMLLEMDPKNKEARRLRAIAYQKLGRNEDAVSDYRVLLERYPDDAKSHYNLGMIYAFKLIDKREALVHFDRFLTLDIRNKKAFDVAKLMCLLDSKNVFAVWNYQKALSEKSDSRKEELLRESLEISPTNSASHELLGRLLMKKGKKSEAGLHMMKASIFSPNDSSGVRISE